MWISIKGVTNIHRNTKVPQFLLKMQLSEEIDIDNGVMQADILVIRPIVRYFVIVLFYVFQFVKQIFIR